MVLGIIIGVEILGCGIGIVKLIGKIKFVGDLLGSLEVIGIYGGSCLVKGIISNVVIGVVG